MDLLPQESAMYSTAQPRSERRFNKINEKITYIITIRFNSKIKSNQRIKYKDRIFNIKNTINVMEENKIMEITAEEEMVNN